MLQKIKATAAALFPELQAMRHHLHQFPELSFQEFETAAYITTILDTLGIPYKKNIGGTGIMAVIEGNKPHRKCIALRADMDALPISEATTVPYRSKRDSIMHACGHDVHMSCLLGAATILNSIRSELNGTVKLIFQPGEEKSPGGANLMIKEKVLENPIPAAIFALHVAPSLPSGTVGFRPGHYMASSDEVHITIEGKGGHAALPNLTIDPITISAFLITSLQQIVSRRSNPLLPTVLSFGKIEGGNTTNVIPQRVTLAGTLRTFDESWRMEAKQLIHDVASQTAAAWGAKARIHFPPGYPSLFNNIALTERAIAAAEYFAGNDKVVPLDLRMTAEDFSFYGQKIPGCFFRLGTNEANERYCEPVHSPGFNIDESAMITGAGLLSWLALQELNLPTDA